MDDNPYTAPHTPSEVLPRSRTSFGFGNVVFLLFGAIFVLVPLSALIWAISDARTVSIAAGTAVALSTLFGMLLIAHGIVRSNGTIAAISCVLLIVAMWIAVAIVLV